MEPCCPKDITSVFSFSLRVFKFSCFSCFYHSVLDCLLYGFPTGYAHFLLCLLCAHFPFDASSQKPLSPFLPRSAVFQSPVCCTYNVCKNWCIFQLKDWINTNRCILIVCDLKMICMTGRVKKLNCIDSFPCITWSCTV